MTNLLDILGDFSEQVPGFLSTSVVHRYEGTSIGNVSHSADLDAEAADAYFTDMMIRHDRAQGVLGIQFPTEDILLSTSEAFFLIRNLPESEYFWVLATSREGNLGYSRAMMRKFSDGLQQSLP